MTIDSYAYINKLKKLHPAEKILFALGMLLVCLLSPSRTACWAVLLVMSVSTVAWAGIRLRVYLKLLAVPMVFLAMSVLPVLFEGAGAGELVYNGGWIVITANSLQRTLSLTARAMGSVSCLYFLSLTTPMIDLFSQLRAWHFPQLLLELMELIYRFLFVILDISRSMVKAQQMRMGYRNLRTGMRSLGQGLSMLLSRTFQRSNMIYSALEVRLYSGSLASLPSRHSRSIAHEIVFAVLFLAAGLLAAL